MAQDQARRLQEKASEHSVGRHPTTLAQQADSHAMKARNAAIKAVWEAIMMVTPEKELAKCRFPRHHFLLAICNEERRRTSGEVIQ